MTLRDVVFGLLVWCCLSGALGFAWCVLHALDNQDQP